MAKYKYDASRIYRLTGVSNSGATSLSDSTRDQTFNDLTGGHSGKTAKTLYDEANTASAATQATTNKEYVNYAFYMLRSEIEDAASNGYTFVDIEWASLIQHSSQAKIEVFLGLTKTKDGKYNKWIAPAADGAANVGETGAPWAQICYLINRSGANYYAISYAYKTNEQYPYAVRLSWRGENYNDSTNEDSKDNAAVHPYYIIENNADAYIDGTEAKKLSDSDNTDQLAFIGQFLATCETKIKGAATASLYVTRIFWSDFGNTYSEGMARLMGVNTEDRTVSGTTYGPYKHRSNDYLKDIKEEFTIYHNDVTYENSISKDNGGNFNKKKTYSSGKLNLFTLLSDLGYGVAWLIHNANSTYDGFTIAWGSGNANTDAGAYNTETTVPAEDTSVILDVFTPDELTTQQDKANRAINTNQLTTFASLLNAKLITAFNNDTFAAAILWTNVDGSIPGSVYKRFESGDGTGGVLKFSGPIKDIAANGTTEVVRIPQDGVSGVNNYRQALSRIFSGSNDKFDKHQVNLTLGLKNDGQEIYVNGSSGGTSLTKTKFSWSYLYYANRWVQEKKVEDGKTKYVLASNHTGASPCGVVISYGTESMTFMAQICEEYAIKFDPNGNL